MSPSPSSKAARSTPRRTPTTICPAAPTTAASLYEHCVARHPAAAPLREHGLPLMGSGDWNDGMNLVGEHGKGESVWLGFFLYDVLMQFAELARRRGDIVLRGRVPGGGGAAAPEHRAARLGWRVVPPRLLRRRHAARIGEQRRMPDRFDRAKLVGSVRRRRRGALAPGHGSARSAPRPPGRGADPASRSAVRQVDAESRLHQRLRPGRAGERRAVHPRGDLGGDGVRRIGRQPARVGTLGHDQPGQPRGIAGRRSTTYKVEPYVVAADVYARSPHTGRGGWTWYTGSAGWMYRLIVESLLGLRLEVDRLRFAPCLPADWKAFKVHYRYRETVYHITVLQTAAGDGERRVTVDGVEQHDQAIPLVDDRREHMVEVSVPIVRGSYSLANAGRSREGFATPSYVCQDQPCGSLRRANTCRMVRARSSAAMGFSKKASIPKAAARSASMRGL